MKNVYHVDSGFIGLGVVYLKYNASKRVAVSTSTSAKTVGKLSFNGNSYEGYIKDGKANGQGTRGCAVGTGQLSSVDGQLLVGFSYI